METSLKPQGTVLEMLTPLQDLSLPSKGPLPSLLQHGGNRHPAGVPTLCFSHSISVLCALELLYFGKTMQPTAGLGQDHSPRSIWSLEVTQGHEQFWEQ